MRTILQPKNQMQNTELYGKRKKVMDMNIPKDPVMLLSYINTQLRDFYSNLDDLCTSLELDRTLIESALGAIDYHYDLEKNQFR